MTDFVGGGGNDTFVGGGDGDTASGGGGNDTLYGNGGNDSLAGDAGGDYLDGGDGDDLLFSNSRDPAGFTYLSYRAISDDYGTEVDTLLGGAGDDFIVAGYGDIIDGGAQGTYGNRLFISFRGASSGVNADFRLLQQNGSITIGGGTITNIQNIGFLEGSEFDDVLVPIDTYYPSGANVYGRGGNDHLIADYYSGWSGSGLYGGDGNDTVDARMSQYSANVFGDAGDDILYTATNGFGTASGGDGNDTIYAHGTINGDAGDDTIYVIPTYYSGFVHGGTGNDMITVQAYGHSAIFGDDGDDQIIGSAYADTLDGGSGSDTITGGGGNNTLRGGTGIDRFVLTAADSSTIIEGGADYDTLAVSGAVALSGLSGIEAIELASGAVLTLTASQFTSGIAANTVFSGTGNLTVNMDAGVAFLAGGMAAGAGSDVSFTVIGTAGTDIVKANLNIRNIINGGDSNDQIRAGNLVDVIDGGNGTDKIMALGGADILTGGAGNDQFRYMLAGDSGIGAASDHITDFAPGSDKLDFRMLDADPVAPGRQVLAYIDTQAFHATGAAEVRYGVSGANLLVEVDLNGDGMADMQIVLDNDAALTLSSGDFLL